MPLLAPTHLFELLLRIPTLKRLNTTNQLPHRVRVVLDSLKPRHNLLRPQHTRRTQMLPQSPLTDLAKHRLRERLGIPPRRIRLKHAIHEPHTTQLLERDLPRHEHRLLREADAHAVHHGAGSGALDHDADRVEGRQ